jgi:hypothetical protein
MTSRSSKGWNWGCSEDFPLVLPRSFVFSTQMFISTCRICGRQSVTGMVFFQRFSVSVSQLLFFRSSILLHFLLQARKTDQLEADIRLTHRIMHHNISERRFVVIWGLHVCHPCCVNTTHNNETLSQYTTLYEVSKATGFGCSKQLSSGFTFQKYKKEIVCNSSTVTYCNLRFRFRDFLHNLTNIWSSTDHLACPSYSSLTQYEV